MAKNQWLEERKDLFLKDLVKNFLESKIFFDELYHSYKKQKSIPYQKMDYWIGSETKKGPLWLLKDNCHKLFRKPKAQSRLSEYLFDWILGSIFHEGMKLKEDVYQLEVYLPTSESISASDDGGEIEEILREYFKLIDRAAKNQEAEIESIYTLFSKAAERLKELLVHHARNGLLARFLIGHKTLINKALGKNSAPLIITLLYQHPEEIYHVAGVSCLKGGWYKDALKYFTKALALNPHHTEVTRWRKEAEKRMHSQGEEYSPDHL